MNRKKAMFLIIPFLTIIISIFTLNIITPDKEVTIAENRALEKRPDINIAGIKNGTFAEKYENYYNDQFVFREKFIYLNRIKELLLNKTKVGFYYLGKDNWLLERYPSLIEDKDMKKYTSMINRLSEISKKDGKDVYYAVTPHKTNTLKHLFPKYADGEDNININVDKFKRGINKDIISFINLDNYMKNNFTKEELENLYYKTDHHWKATGAFNCFKEIVSNMDLGLSKEELNNYFSSYKTFTVKDKGFIGSYNRNIYMLIDEKEYVNYVYKDGSEYKFDLNGEEKREEDVFAVLRNKSEWDYSGAYITGKNASILNITNEKALVDKKILIFIDSYEAPTTLMYADLFKNVELADPRNITELNKSYKDIIDESDSDIVLFMYNNFGLRVMMDSMLDTKLE